METIKENNNNDILNNILRKYEYLKVILERTNKDITFNKEQIDKIYKKAVKVQIEEYNCKKSLNLQIYERMKKILLDYRYRIEFYKDESKKLNQQDKKEVLPNKQLVEEPYTKIDNEKIINYEQEEPSKIEEKVELIDEKGRFNLSFLKILLTKKIMRIDDLAIDLQISINMLEKVLSGEYHLKEEKLNRLYKRYKTNNVYDLKTIIENLEEKKDEYMPKKIEYKEQKVNLKISTSELEEYNDELINLLQEYMIVKNISGPEFSRRLGCNNQVMYCIMNNIYKISKSVLIKLFIYFNSNKVKDLINVLREETKNYTKSLEEIKLVEIDEYTNEIAELLQKYLEINNLTKKRFAELVGCTIFPICNIINKKNNISEEMYQKFYNYFKVSSKEELILLLKKETQKYNEVMEEKKEKIIKEQDIRDEIVNLIKLYLTINNISLYKFGKLIGTDGKTLGDILNKKRDISELMYQKLYNYFKVSSREELISLLKKETENYDELIKKQKEKIEEEKRYSDQIGDLIGLYLVINNISVNKFGKLIKTDTATIKDIINKKRIISKLIYQRLYNYFKVSTKEELISYLKEETEKCKNIIEKNKKDLEKYSVVIRELLIKYLELNKLTIKKFSNLIGFSESKVRRIIEEIHLYEKAEILLNYFKVTTIEDLIIKLVEEIAAVKNSTLETERIDKDLLFKIVDISTLIDEEYIIFMLLFGEKRCLPSVISELLKIDESYILDIYNNYLNKYIEATKTEKISNVKKLEADN